MCPSKFLMFFFSFCFFRDLQTNKIQALIVMWVLTLRLRLKALSDQNTQPTVLLSLQFTTFFKCKQKPTL